MPFYGLFCLPQFHLARSKYTSLLYRSDEESKQGHLVTEPRQHEHDAQHERHHPGEEAQSLGHPRNFPTQGSGEDPDESGVGSHGEDGPCNEHAYEREHGCFRGQCKRRDDDEECVWLQSIDHARRERSQPEVPGSFFDLHLVFRELVSVFGHGSAFPYPSNADGHKHESHKRRSEVGHERDESFHAFFEDDEHGTDDQLSDGMSASPETTQCGA
mmetsp:Transcript_2576/g.9237  ORF Transcript_2576/g.9237 Transcript_2576/m.9237 type:complete len:215 (-) Transcript_2576:430-1074(-)